MHNTQLPAAALGFSPLELDPTFPLRIVLNGRRDDQPITLLHVHNALEIGCCLEGSGTFYIGPKVLPFQTGDVTVITDREYHRCRSSPGTSSRWAWFFLHPSRLLVPHATPRLSWEPERFCGPRFENVLGEKAQPAITGLVQQIVREAHRNEPCVRQNLRCLFVLLINELHREFEKSSPRFTGQSGSASSAARLSPALELIAGRFHEPLTIPEMARACGMSVRGFEVHFKQWMEQSPRDYLLRCRVQAAAALLQATERGIAEVAYECGFGSLSTFNRAFAKYIGTAPRVHRGKRS